MTGSMPDLGRDGAPRSLGKPRPRRPAQRHVSARHEPISAGRRKRICRAGFACLLPAHTLNAFEAIPGSVWQFCWVCYQRPDEQRPIADSTSPVMARFDPLPLQSAILGLMYECNGPGQPTLMQEWSDLIHAYVLRFAQPKDQPDQLRALWERVAAHLGDRRAVDGEKDDESESKGHPDARGGRAEKREHAQQIVEQDEQK